MSGSHLIKHMENPNVRKFGIIGTSCAGKTTLAHTLVGRLKSYGILADGLFSQDRKFSFDKKFLETEWAQNWMISNLIAKEIDLSLHGDVDVLITDRTPIDLFAYYAYQHDTPLSRTCWEYAKEWAKSYDALYFLEALPFQDDGKRPPDEFRLGVETVLRRLLTEVPNVHMLSRHDVMNDVLKRIGFRKPGVKMDFTPEDAQALANHLGFPLVVKNSVIKDALSDYDAWVIAPFNYPIEAARNYAAGVFGTFVPLELNIAVSPETLTFEYTRYDPA